MKHIQVYDSFFGNIFKRKKVLVIPDTKDTHFKVGDIVKFSKNSVSVSRIKSKYDIKYYKILQINEPENKTSINKGISIRPISNKSNELIYMSGDFINQSTDDLELLTDKELKDIEHIIAANKYNL